MRVITVNVNGIRAAARKGFFSWLGRQRADVVCLQEVRAQADQIGDPLFHPRRYHCHYLYAQRKGYSGVALYCRQPPDAVVEGLGWPEVDREARYLEVQYPGLSVVSLYIPSGTSGGERQDFKMAFLARFGAYLQSLHRQPRQYLICGDFNIAHKAVDLKNWRSNQKNSGFLPEERAWMDQLFGPIGYRDGFRLVDPRPEQYTWWSNRGQAWDNNVGWRLDYQVATPDLAATARRARVYKTKRFSDHAPLIMDYDFDW